MAIYIDKKKSGEITKVSYDSPASKKLAEQKAREIGYSGEIKQKTSSSSKGSSGGGGSSKEHKVTNVVTAIDPETHREVEIPVAKTESGEYLYQTKGGETKIIKAEGGSYSEQRTLGKIAKEYLGESAKGKTISVGSVPISKYSDYKIAQEYTSIKKGEKTAWVTPEGELVTSKDVAPGGIREEVAVKRGFIKLEPKDVSYNKGRIIGSYTLSEPIVEPKPTENIQPLVGVGKEPLPEMSLTEKILSTSAPSLVSPFFTKDKRTEEQILASTPIRQTATQEQTEFSIKQQEVKERAFGYQEQKLKELKIFEIPREEYKGKSTGLEPAKYGVAELGKGVARGIITLPETILHTPSFIVSSVTHPVKTATEIKTEFLKNPAGVTGEFIGIGIGFKGLGKGIKTIRGVKTTEFKQVGEPFVVGRPTGEGGAFEIFKMSKSKAGVVKEEIFKVDLKKTGKEGTYDYTLKKIYDNKPVNEIIETGKTKLKAEQINLLKERNLLGIKDTGEPVYYGDKPLLKSTKALSESFGIEEYPIKNIKYSQSVSEAVKFKEDPFSLFDVTSKTYKITPKKQKIGEIEIISPKVEPVGKQSTAKGIFIEEPIKQKFTPDIAYSIQKGTKLELVSALGEPLITITKTTPAPKVKTIYGSLPITKAGKQEVVKEISQKPKTSQIPKVETILETSKEIYKKQKPLTLQAELQSQRQRESYISKLDIAQTTRPAKEHKTTSKSDLLQEKRFIPEKILIPEQDIIREQRIEQRKTFIPAIKYKLKMDVDTTPTPPQIELPGFDLPPAIKPFRYKEYKISEEKPKKRKRDLSYWEIKHKVPELLDVLRLKV